MLADGWCQDLMSTGVEVRAASVTTSRRDSRSVVALAERTGNVADLGHTGRATTARTVLRLRKLIRSEGIDVVHAFLAPAEAYAAFATMGVGVPVVGTLVSTLPGAYRRVGKWPEPTRRICVGQQVHRAALAAGLAPAVLDVVRPSFGLVPPPPREGDPWPFDSTGRSVVISVGRLQSGKNHTALVKAMALLPEQVVLAIVGDGPERPNIKHEAEAIGVGDRVHLLGQRSDVPELLAASDVYASATLNEGFVGYSTIEAAWAGVPVVVSDIPEVTELFGDEHVALVDPRQPSVIAEAVASMLAEPGRRPSLAKQLVGECFEPATIAADLRRVYDAVDSSNNGA